MKTQNVLAALGVLALAACGTGSATVSTEVSGERSGVSAAPAFFTTAKPDNSNTDGTGGETADAPITESVSAVTLSVEKIVAHRADESDANAKEGSEKDGESGWEVLVASPKQIELISAASDATEAVLGDSQLTEGKYTQIRLYLAESGNTITVGGVSHALTVPSGALKLVGNVTVEADKTYKMEIKFDLDKSLVINNQGYKLKPTVKYSLTER